MCGGDDQRRVRQALTQVVASTSSPTLAGGGWTVMDGTEMGLVSFEGASDNGDLAALPVWLWKFSGVLWATLDAALP